MPDHVPKSSPLPKLLIKRNFNSLNLIYWLQNCTKLHVRKRSRVPRKTHSTGIRDHVTNAIQLGFGCALPIATPFVPSFPPLSSPSPSPPWRCLKRVVACSTILPRVQQVRLPVDPTAFQPPTKYSANISAILFLFFAQVKTELTWCHVYISLESMLILFSLFSIITIFEEYSGYNFDGIASILHDAKYFVDGFGSKILDRGIFRCAKDIVDSLILSWTLYHEVFRQWRRS